MSTARLTLFIFFCSLLPYCTGSFVGTETETQSGTIAGIIRNKSGAPLSDADVILHDNRNSGTTAQTTRTDNDGRFIFDSLSDGRYLVEVNDNDRNGAMMATEIDPEHRSVNIQGTARLLGTIFGRIDSTKISVDQSITVVLPEIQRSAVSNSAYLFTINKLPQWDYLVQLKADNKLVTLPSDTLRISVAAGDTVFIHSLGSESGSVTVKGKIYGSLK